MNSLYLSIGTTKQNIHQRLNRQLALQEEQAQLLSIIGEIRSDHPRMGARTLYKLVNPERMGRDRFIHFCYEQGLKLSRPKNYRKTTDSTGVIRFPNLIEGIELTGVNQVWVSDITYYQLGDSFHYLTFIMDLFSRRIIGYQASKTLRTVDTTIPALKMALRRLSSSDRPIFHSDGGGQYYSKEFLKLSKGRLLNSMCKTVYENPHAERVNRTIKNDYLIPYQPHTTEQLKKMLHKAVKMYNEQKPHKSLGSISPVSFELLKAG